MEDDGVMASMLRVRLVSCMQPQQRPPDAYIHNAMLFISHEVALESHLPAALVLQCTHCH